MSDQQAMAVALELAREAALAEEVPVGAVLVQGGEIVATGSNCPIREQDPTAHAEIVALRRAAKVLQNYRLPGTTLYVTLEPCAMCAGAIVHSRVERLVFGARDPRSGAVESVFGVLDEKKLNHRVIWEGGVLADDCSALLKQFFRERRLK